MKVKGINVFEQHLEKVVVGVAALGALSLVAWHVLSVPTAKVGSQDLPFGEVDRRLETKAREVESKLDGQGGVQVASPDALSLADQRLAERMKAGVSPVQSLARTAPNFNGSLVKSGLVRADAVYYVPTVPTVQMLGTEVTADALTVDGAKDAAAASPVLASRFGQEITSPQDVVWTTPYARIDLKAIRAELAGSNPGATPPRVQVPGVWYQDTAYVVDLVFERREQLADGSFGPVAEVPVFAARSEELMFRPRLTAPAAEFRDDVFQLLGVEDNQREIVQPTFYDTVNNAFISPELALDEPAAPEDAPGQTADARRKAQIQAQLAEKTRRAEQLRAELTKLGGPWDFETERRKEEERKKEERDRKRDERAGGGAGGGGRGPGGGPGGGGSMSGKANAAGDSAAKDERRKAVDRQNKTRQLQRLEADIARIQAELGTNDAAAPAGDDATPAASAALSAKDELVVWAHDLEVEPGRTYQYRCRVRVYNPFFARGNLLVDEQRGTGIGDRCVLESAPSEWSAPVRVSTSVRFFLTQASIGDGSMGLGSAKFEIYRLVDGKWRRSEVSVQPGERIGRVDQRGGDGVDFSTEYYVVDIVEAIPLGRGEATPAARDRRPGLVVIASVDRPEMGAEVRDPQKDSADPERPKLRSQAATSTAASGGD